MLETMYKLPDAYSEQRYGNPKLTKMFGIYGKAVRLPDIHLGDIFGYNHTRIGNENRNGIIVGAAFTPEPSASGYDYRLSNIAVCFRCAKDFVGHDSDFSYRKQFSSPFYMEKSIWVCSTVDIEELTGETEALKALSRRYTSGPISDEFIEPILYPHRNTESFIIP